MIFQLSFAQVKKEMPVGVTCLKHRFSPQVRKNHGFQTLDFSTINNKHYPNLPPGGKQVRYP
jgi:hypothetical protein